MQEVPDRARGLGAEIGASSAPLLDEANAIGLNRTRHRVPVVGVEAATRRGLGGDTTASLRKARRRPPLKYALTGRLIRTGGAY